LIHGGTINEGVKYILRTDLIVTSDENSNINKIDTTQPKLYLEKKIEDLTKSLFRQAQYNELNSLPCSELYERCISLRQNPSKLTKYPEHLEELIQYETINNCVTSELKYIKRRANKHVFEYTTKLNNKFNLLKTATLFTILSLTKSMSDLQEKSNEILKIINNDGLVLIPGMLDIYQDVDESDLKKSSTDSDSDSCVETEADILKSTKEACENNDTFLPRYFAQHGKITEKNVKKFINDDDYDYLVDEESKETLKFIDGKINMNWGDDLTDELYKIYDENVEYKTDDTAYVLKYLFDVNENYLETCDNSTTIKPLSTILKKHTVIADVFARRCYSGCCDGYTINDEELFMGYSFDVSFDNYIMNLSNVLFREDIITGKIDIQLPSESFNHASCQGQIVSRTIIDLCEENIEIINYEIDFTINSTEIILDIVPKIVV